jgi:hypothetical protein
MQRDYWYWLRVFYQSIARNSVGLLVVLTVLVSLAACSEAASSEPLEEEQVEAGEPVDNQPTTGVDNEPVIDETPVETPIPTGVPLPTESAGEAGDPDTFGRSAVDALADEYVSCVETEPHPIGEQIAMTYSVDYEEVMKLFCNGDTFDDILVAYQTSQQTDIPAAELLDMAARAGGWEPVWDELGLLE